MMIDIDHVSFQYSGAERENLQNFNLQIEKGECVVLTGESGCGKTCVTRLINTLIPHFYEGEMSGTVLIDGVDTRTIQPHDLSDKIGSVFQNPRSQFFSLDTDSEIVFGMENKGMPYQVMLDRYQQTIQELHIEKLKDRNLFDLSGGQKQTIAFASVYALNPDIFVLDEPSSNLDPEAIQELRRLLLLIKAQGKTIIVSEHRLYFLNGIADRIVLMEHGMSSASMILQAGIGITIFVGAILLTSGQIELLPLLMFLLMVTRIYGPILAILANLSSLLNLNVVTSRMRTLLTTPAMDGDGKTVPNCDIELSHVTFAYNQEDVIIDVSCKIPQGSVTALVGPSGSGKSTISKLIARFWDVQKGKITVGGKDIKSMEPESLMSYMSFVFQDVTLFNDTVMNNIRLGNPSATDDQVIAAAKAAYTNFLFLNQSGLPKTASCYESMFQGLVRKYNKHHKPDEALPNITPHTMRHTFCTRLAQAGMNPKDLQYIMGHSNITMTLNYYAHADYASAKAAMDKLAA